MVEWFERKGELKKEFDAAKDRKDPSKLDGTDGGSKKVDEGSRQVKEDQPPIKPAPPPGPGTRAVDRRAHQERMNKDHQAARASDQPKGAGAGEQAGEEGYAEQRRRSNAAGKGPRPLRDKFNERAKRK